MRLEFELRCILFPLIILKMFLYIDWSSPVVHLIQWTWFGKAHTCLFKVPQLTVHVREKNLAMRSKELSVELWDRIVSRHRSGEGYQKMSAALKVHKITVPSIIIKWKKFGTFLDLAGQPNWAIRGEGPWSGRWPRTRWSLWQSSRVPLWEKLPEGQPSLQHSTNQAFKVDWPDGRHSSVKGTWQPA